MISIGGALGGGNYLCQAAVVFGSKTVCVYRVRSSCFDNTNSSWLAVTFPNIRQASRLCSAWLRASGGEFNEVKDDGTCVLTHAGKDAYLVT